MRYVLIAAAIMVVLVPASALAVNPEAKVFVTFTSPTPDNASIVNRVDPENYTGFTAYLGVTDLGTGIKGINFAMSVTPGMSSPAAFTNLLPGDLAIGNWETGIALASTDCMNTDADAGREYIDPVIFAKLDLFYLGVTGDVLFVDHPEYPRWILDCDEPAAIDYFCVYTNGGVGKDAVAGDAECTPDTPVDASSWGAIKALYQ